VSDTHHGSLAWFDLYVDDAARAKEFYGQLFGWTFAPLPGMDAWTINTGGDGNTVGSLLKREANSAQPPAQSTSIYMNVANLDDSFALATGLGASVMIPPLPIPGTVNFFALVRDPEQNNIGLVSPVAASAGQW